MERVPNLRGLLDAAIEIASERAAILKRMKEALKQGDKDRVVKIAEELFGVECGAKSNRAN